jgi:hypothetical protein
MTLSRSLRPALVILSGILVASCSAVEDEAFSFEALAQEVASIPVDGPSDIPSASEALPSSQELGLRPALHMDPQRPGSLVVEVLDPHALWDARDGLRRSVTFTPDISSVKAERAQGLPHPRLPPQVAQGARSASAPAASRPSLETIQLGAFSSESAARAAWGRVSTGPAAEALAGLEPDFVTAQINGRSVVRLRISAPSARASVICRTADINDSWCLKAT